MKSASFLFLFLFLFLHAAPARAEGLGEGFGVQIKETVTSAELAQIRASGFGFVRLALYWDVVEREKGVYDWSGWDPLLERIKASGLNVLLTVTSGHPLYDGRVRAPEGNRDGVAFRTRAPSSPASIEAFARFAAAAALRYDGPGVRWEIWNEPDYRRFWAPRPDVDRYVVLATRTCALMKAVAPEAFVVGPALGDVPDHQASAFLETVLHSPAAGCFDAVSLHPYRPHGQEPEGVYPAYAGALRQMIFARNTKPLMNSEWGFSDVIEGREAQADAVLRTRLVDALHGFRASVWYEWRDSRPPSGNPESGYGLTDYAGHEKPALRSLRGLLPLLYNAQLDRRLFTADKAQFVLLVRRQAGSVVALGWRQRQAGETVCLDVDGARLEIRLETRVKMLAQGREIKVCEATSPQPDAR